MKKQKIFLLIPILIIGGFLIYTWATFIFTNVVSTWRHYLSTILYFIILILFFKNQRATILAILIYLILGTLNILTLTPSVTSDSYGVGIGSVELWTPKFQTLSFALLVLTIILNFDTIVNWYLDYKDSKSK